MSLLLLLSLFQLLWMIQPRLLLLLQLAVHPVPSLLQQLQKHQHEQSVRKSHWIRSLMHCCLLPWNPLGQMSMPLLVPRPQLRLLLSMPLNLLVHRGPRSSELLPAKSQLASTLHE